MLNNDNKKINLTSETGEELLRSRDTATVHRLGAVWAFNEEFY
jgi:hypothetical protein